MPMPRFLRRAAFAAAVGGVLYAAAKGRNPSEPLPSSGPSSTAAAAGGHLALIRAHTELRDLNALLTPRSFLIDATQAFLASALRSLPFLPPGRRRHLDAVSSQILSAEAKGDAQAANRARLDLALFDARNGGRLEDALGACARVVAEDPSEPSAPIIAAVLCRMLGRSEEEARWVRRVPHLSDPVSKELVQKLETLVVFKATLGCAPRAAGADKLVLGTMLGLVEMSMWSIFDDGGLTERFQVLAFMLLLRRLVAMNAAADTTTPSS